ncbi:MAG: hypothetical protein LBD79_01785 [Treponema sp.]|nr:hypothetical protein [Treponema sp.]
MNSPTKRAPSALKSSIANVLRAPRIAGTLMALLERRVSRVVRVALMSDHPQCA